VRFEYFYDFLVAFLHGIVLCHAKTIARTIPRGVPPFLSRSLRMIQDVMRMTAFLTIFLRKDLYPSSHV